MVVKADGSSWWVTVVVVLWGAVLAAAPVSAEETRVFIRGGAPRAVRVEGVPWGWTPNRLEATGEWNVLYADAFLGGSDFTLRARLSLKNHPDSAAGLVINGNNIFGLASGSGGRFFVEGRLFGGKTTLLDAPSDVIIEGEPFLLEVTRRSDRLTFAVDGKNIWSTTCTARWFGEVGFRPWRATMQLIDFEIAGTFIDLQEYVLNLAPGQGEQHKAAAQAGLFTINPVVLPEGDKLVGNNWHFGWPVGTQVDGELVALFNRARHHHGSHRPADRLQSTAVAVRSLDGGSTWLSPQDLRQFLKPGIPTKPGGMRAIGVAPDGALVYVGDMGSFRSEDRGRTWTHYPDAFAAEPVPAGIASNIGPRIVNTPDGELLLLAHVIRRPLNYVDEMWLYRSRDGGRTWYKTVKPTPPLAKAMEPCPLIWNGKLIVVGRSHCEDTYEPQTRTRRYVQLWAEDLDAPFEAAYTNIRVSDASEAWAPIAGTRKARAFGYWAQDTVDIAINPLNGRIELVATNRTGGGQGDEQDLRYQTLNLWSIDPAELTCGASTWQFEGTLLRRHSLDVTKFIDGMHPAGAVMDDATGVQHIFVYLGYYHGPAGMFRITRTLETDRLRRFFELSR